MRTISATYDGLRQACDGALEGGGIPLDPQLVRKVRVALARGTGLAKIHERYPDLEAIVNHTEIVQARKEYLLAVQECMSRLGVDKEREEIPLRRLDLQALEAVLDNDGPYLSDAKIDSMGINAALARLRTNKILIDKRDKRLPGRGEPPHLSLKDLSSEEQQAIRACPEIWNLLPHQDARFHVLLRVIQNSLKGKKTGKAELATLLRSAGYTLNPNSIFAVARSLEAVGFNSLKFCQGRLTERDLVLMDPADRSKLREGVRKKDNFVYWVELNDPITDSERDEHTETVSEDLLPQLVIPVLAQFMELWSAYQSPPPLQNCLEELSRRLKKVPKNWLTEGKLTQVSFNNSDKPEDWNFVFTVQNSI
ncbi:MAG: hypothetical protein WC777_02025 [Candidatus Gracilibacteria bacterium]|jgi:hypothetical protein